MGVHPKFRFLNPESVSSTYSLEKLVTRLILENDYLRRQRGTYHVGSGYPLPDVEEVEQDDRYVFVRQYSRESPKPVDGRHLVLANEYAGLNNQYANGFIHRRVKLYQEAGLNIDVMAFGKRVRRDVYHYDGVHVLAGYVNELLGLLKSRNYESISIHFLNFEMWRTIKDNVPEGTKVLVYLHGYEVRNWVRVPWTIETKAQLDDQIERSLRLADTWREITDVSSIVTKFIFVSEWWKNAVSEDLGLTFRDSRVIHNVIDSNFFSYIEKAPDQRFKLLWIRNGRKFNYGADMAAEILSRLRNTKYWQKIEVLLVGDGPYFKAFDQFKDCPNVEFREGYISQREISKLHKEFGLLLVPSRWDTQGVSRDEGMSSGLIPITSPVDAIPEFVDSDIAIFGDEKNYQSWVEDILRIMEDPELFMSMSRNAALHVRQTSPAEKTVDEELKLMNEEEK